MKTISTYAKQLQIAICVENLTKGVTTELDNLEALLSIENVFLCLDTGHADVVEKMHPGFCAKLISIVDSAIHSHIYYSEDKYYNHIPFDTNNIHSSALVDALIDSRCSWFTMELDSIAQQIDQADLLCDCAGYDIPLPKQNQHFCQTPRVTPRKEMA